jgi:hypothetical protein
MQTWPKEVTQLLIPLTVERISVLLSAACLLIAIIWRVAADDGQQFESAY